MVIQHRERPLLPLMVRRSWLVNEDPAGHEGYGRSLRASGSGWMLSQRPWLGGESGHGSARTGAGRLWREPRHGREVLDKAREAALMREVLRTQGQHGEGGVEPELDETDEDLRREA